MTDNPPELTPKSAKYISVMLPKSVLTNNQDSNTSIEDLVLTDTTKAFNLLKQVKGSRLRMFDNYEDALNCSIEGLSDSDLNRDPPKEKVTANFPTPPPPELSRLRRAIEMGDSDLVFSMVSSNPKFLITSSDTPVILMEGPRYNAVHIASKYNRLCILDFILKTVNDPAFIKKLYPNDSETITEETRKHLVDLYLNTPDKAALDTPLHFASKFAAADCVKLLLSYPGCDRERRNKFNETPYDVICSRKSESQASKIIKDCFEARFYVAINRKFDRVTVCKPSETPPKDDSISGIAGPMSPKLAEEIYHTLKSPAKSTSPRKFRIRFTDGSRGLERVAWMECRRYNLNWVEYWPFLDCYVDLASEEGLEILEKHLKKVHGDLTSKQPNVEESSRSVNLINNSTQDQSTMSLLCDRLGSLALTSNQNIQQHEDNSSSGRQDNNDRDNVDEKNDPVSSDDESEGIYATPPSSPIIEHDYFVNGKLISQSDKDAANALMDVTIDQFRFPYIAQWLRKVKLKQSIPSPYRDTRGDSFSTEAFNIALCASTPRKSINLIDLISPRRFSFNDEHSSSDEDVFQDSMCQIVELSSADSSSEINKENIEHNDILKGKSSSSTKR